jgi:predicted GIY-YIG superfamily endonuclease
MECAKENCWYLYILKCRDGSLYTGITNNIPLRLKRHNEGTASRYTRSRLPVRIIFREICRNKSHALKKEHAIKSMTRKRKEAYIKLARCSAGEQATSG